MKFKTFSILLIFFFSVGIYGQGNNGDNDPIKGTFVNEFKYEVTAIPDQTARIGQQPKNIILMIADGLGITHLTAAYTANGGSLYITNMPYSGFVSTQSADRYNTDSAAAGTAFATGERTFSGAVGVDVNKNPLPTILEIADQQGKSTGLVASCAMIHATPAAFIAHTDSRHNYEAMAVDFLKTDIDIFIGGGRNFFEKREDGRNLLVELENKNYKILNSLEEASKVEQGPLAIFIAGNHPPRWPERGDLVPDGTQKAIEILSINEKGYFLMVEGSQIDWGGHQNNIAFIVEETLDFDRAVGRALKLAAEDGETLVIVTSDHETGGMSLVNGNFEKGEISAKFSTGGHTGVMVPVFAYGPGAEHFTGVMKNTDIFLKTHALFGF